MKIHTYFLFNALARLSLKSPRVQFVFMLLNVFFFQRVIRPYIFKGRFAENNFETKDRMIRCVVKNYVASCMCCDYDTHNRDQLPLGG